MKIFKNKIVLTLFMLVILIKSAPLSYAYFDETSANKNVLLQTGYWEYAQETKTYFTSFENFINDSYYLINECIDGEFWSLCNVVSADSLKDKKIGQKSIRIANCGFLASDKYFIGLELISFYIGLANDSDNRGLRKFSVEVSNDGSSWTNVLTEGTTASEFRLVNIDMKNLLANGLSLGGGVVANEYTPLRVKISFDGTSPVGSIRLFNLDDLTIKYNG